MTSSKAAARGVLEPTGKGPAADGSPDVRDESSSVEDVGEGLVPASLADAAIGIPAILMTVLLVLAHSDLVAILIIIVVAVVTVAPFERVVFLDRAGNEPLKLATVEPDASALLANVDRHAVATTFVER
jgi:hypothetical protein